MAQTASKDAAELDRRVRIGVSILPGLEGEGVSGGGEIDLVLTCALPFTRVGTCIYFRVFRGGGFSQFLYFRPFLGLSKLPGI